MSSLKNSIRKICPKVLRKPAMAIVHQRRLICNKVEYLFLAKKMKFFCPCCGMKIKSFKKADYLDAEHYNHERYVNTRQEVLCPVCNALPRHRILASWCETRLPFLKSSKILYFAPEYSMTRWLKKNGVKYTTADLFAEADLKLDIQDTKLPDESYDVVVCNHVLEHVDDFRKALRELYRIIRKGGKLICSFPMDPKVELLDEDPSVDTEEGRLARFGQNDHKRVFGMKADQFLQEAGFKVTPIRGEAYPEEILPVVGPADYDMNILFCCSKVEDEKLIDVSIDKEIDAYLNEKMTTGCLLINGGWGSGKTFFLENYAKKNEDKYAIARVSLFGLENANYMRKAVREEFITRSIGKTRAKLRKARKKAKRGVEKTVDLMASLSPDARVGAVAQGAEKLLNFDYSDFYEIKNEIKKSRKKKQFVLVFDDFERCRIPMVNRLGVINDYIENLKIKVLILVDESHIDHHDKYNEFKEKVVSRTIQFRNNHREVIASIIESFQFETEGYKEFVERYQHEFYAAYKDSGYSNYRSFIASVCNFERVFKAWRNEGVCNDFNSIQSLVYLFGARLYEAKAGNYIKDSQSESYVLNKEKSDEEENAQLAIKEKYRRGVFNWEFYSLSRWIVDGEWDKERFLYELEQKYAFPDVPRNKLLRGNLWELEQKDIEQNYSEVVENAYAGDLSRSELLSLLYISHELNKNGIAVPCDIDYSKVLNGLKNRIEGIRIGKIEEPETNLVLNAGDIDQDAVPILELSNRMKRRLLAWNNRRAFINLCQQKEKDVVEINDFRRKEIEEFDDEMRILFFSSYKTSNNLIRDALTTMLKTCIFDSPDCSDENNIKNTIDNFSKLVEELETMKESQIGNISWIITNDTIKALEEKKKKLISGNDNPERYLRDRRNRFS